MKMKKKLEIGGRLPRGGVDLIRSRFPSSQPSPPGEGGPFGRFENSLAGRSHVLQNAHRVPRDAHRRGVNSSSIGNGTAMMCSSLLWLDDVAGRFIPEACTNFLIVGGVVERWEQAFAKHL